MQPFNSVRIWFHPRTTQKMEMVRALSESNSAVLTRRRYSLCSPSHSGLTITIARADGEDIEDEENKWKELGLQNAG